MRFCSWGVHYRWGPAFAGFRPGIDLLDVATQFNDASSKQVALKAVKYEANAATTEAGIDSAIPLIWQDAEYIPKLSAEDRTAVGNQISNFMQAMAANVMFQQGDAAAACRLRDTIQDDQARTHLLVVFFGGEGPKWQR